MYSYYPLNLLCKPQTIAKTDNTKFLMNDITSKLVYPLYKPLFNPPKTQNHCSNCSNTNWKKDPKLWGPHLWSYMHYSAANYPNNPTDQEIDDMKKWLCSLPVTIPCNNCSKHYKQYIDKNKYRLDDICSCRDKLFNFLVDIHNKVNIRNGKREINYNEARKMYNQS